MNKYLSLLLALLAFAVVSADAKTIKIPSDEDAIGSITFPNDWTVEAIDGGYGADSPDEHVYLAIVVVDNEKDMNAELDDTFEMLKEHNVELDPSTKKENKFKINGLDAEELLYQGKDEDGPTGVSISFVPLEDKLIVLTYWVTTAQEEKHQATVGKIINSLKIDKK